MAALGATSTAPRTCAARSPTTRTSWGRTASPARSRYHYQPWGSCPVERVARNHELIAASMPFLRNNLVYHPEDGSLSTARMARYKRETASYDASRIPVYLDRDLSEGSVFRAMNAAVGYGFLRVLDGGERPTFRDVAILRRLPNELSAVAGVITLEPQTPAVAREPARRAGRGAERLHRHRAGRSRDRRAHRQVRALRGDGESRAPRTRSPRRPRSRWRRTTKAVARLRRRPRSGTCR